jgi:RNA polymerase sigma factor (sigma-70 family)
MLRRHDPLEDLEPLIRRVYSYAAYRLGPGPDAEDVTSETLERALRYRRSYRREDGTPQAWLLAIARRVVEDHVGRVRLETSRAHGVSASLGDDPAVAAVERLTLRDAIALLSKDERDLVALRYGADLAVRDIAHITGARTNTLEVALHRVIGKLRTHMDATLQLQEKKHERA